MGSNRNKKYEMGRSLSEQSKGLVSHGHSKKKGYTREVFAPVARIEAIQVVFGPLPHLLGHSLIKRMIKVLFSIALMIKRFNVSQRSCFVEPDHPTKEQHGYKRGTIDKTLFIRRNKKDIMLVQVMCFVHVFMYSKDFLHLNAVQRDLQLSQGKPNLGLWYPKESPHDFEAISDVTMVVQPLYRKSINRHSLDAKEECQEHAAVAPSPQAPTPPPIPTPIPPPIPTPTTPPPIPTPTPPPIPTPISPTIPNTYIHHTPPPELNLQYTPRAHL
ncbi:hypothetical protein Tco_0226374 [Tanacetum coccineum]